MASLPTPYPDLVDLTDDGATDGSLVGAKAANLARALRAGLPVLPGAVLTTAWDHRGWSHPSRYGVPGPATAAWRTLGNEGARPLVVRSSSTGEDGGSSSMAGAVTSVVGAVTSVVGAVTSVVGVTDWPDFVDAVEAVLESGHRADVRGARTAVLVQPRLTARWRGVLFGADPVSGRADRLRVSTVAGGPARLVSGLVEDRRGDGGPLPRSSLRAMAGLAARAAQTLGGPQDIEWAIDHDGTLWLLQSRPVTTATGRPAGLVPDTGPVDETFRSAPVATVIRLPTRAVIDIRGDGTDLAPSPTGGRDATVISLAARR